MGAVDVMAGPGGGDGGDPANGTKGLTAEQKKQQQKNREDNKKKKCDKTVSKSEQDELRKGTPSDANRAQVQKQTKCYSCLRPVAGGLVGGHKMEADHIVPFKQIIGKPGFACLNKKDKMSVLNDPRNMIGLCKNCNGSKGARTWDEWKGHKKIPFGSSGAGRSAQVAGQNLGARRDAMINDAISGMPWNT
jgi:5-methylcytosine-specific restriction endonuclease McrA